MKCEHSLGKEPSSTEGNGILAEIRVASGSCRPNWHHPANHEVDLVQIKKVKRLKKESQRPAGLVSWALIWEVCKEACTWQAGWCWMWYLKGQETAQALVSQNELVHEGVNRNPARLCYLWTQEPNLGFSEEDVRLGFQAVSCRFLS